MIEGWAWFVIPLILPAAIVGVAVASAFGPDVLPTAAMDRARKSSAGKKRKLGINSLWARLGISLFCGVIIVGIGFGAVFPVISRVAAPVVCGHRKLDLETSTWSTPGQTTISLHWSCVDESTGSSEAVGFLGIPLTSGLMHAAIIFAAWSLVLLWLPRLRRQRLARMRNAKVTIEAITKPEETNDPWTFTLKVEPDVGVPFVVTVKKRPYENLLGRDEEKSWTACQRGYHFRAEYDPLLRRRLYLVSLG